MNVSNPLTLNETGRGLLLGQTGTGKTTLAEFLLAKKRHLIIVDPKHQFSPQFETLAVYTASELPDAARRIHKIKKEHGRNVSLMYRPSIDDLEGPELDRVFRWIFDRENTFVYIDELTGVVRGPQTYPLGLRAIYTQGRSKGIGVLAATQRPAYLPNFIFSETETFWKFYLLLKDDREKADDWMHPHGENKRHEPLVNHSKYSFWYYHLGMDAAKEYELDLGGK